MSEKLLPELYEQKLSEFHELWSMIYIQRCYWTTGDPKPEQLARNEAKADALERELWPEDFAAIEQNTRAGGEAVAMLPKKWREEAEILKGEMPVEQAGLITGLISSAHELEAALSTRPAAGSGDHIADAGKMVGSGEAVPDVLREAWLHERDDDYDIYDIEGNPNPPCPECRRVLIVAAPVPAGSEVGNGR